MSDKTQNRSVYFRDLATVDRLRELGDATSLSENLIINMILERHLPEYIRKPGSLLSQTRR